MSSEDRRPDWKFWKNVPNWTILGAVALSMDIDPKKLHYKSHRKTSGIMIEWVEVRDESPEFEKRLELAILNIYSNRKLKVTSSGPGDREKWEITHASFAALAVGCWWTGDVPPELAALAEPDKRDAEILNLKQQVEALTQERDKLHAEVDDLTVKLQAADRPLGERSRKSYLRIIAVLLEYISGTFPTVGKHPSFKNEAQLIALIDSKFKGFPGLSERNLQGKFSEAKQSLGKT